MASNAGSISSSLCASRAKDYADLTCGCLHGFNENPRGGLIRVHEQCHTREARHDFFQELQAFARDVSAEVRQSGDIFPRAGQCFGPISFPLDRERT